MKKIVKLTESELTRIVKRIIKEVKEDEYYDEGPQTSDEVAHKWYEKTDDDFFTSFIEEFPSKRELLEQLPNYTQMIEYLEDNYSFPGEDYLYDFFNDLDKVNW